METGVAYSTPGPGATALKSMELRNHPLMSYQGVANWPPIWVQTPGRNIKTLKGEIGILRTIVRHKQTPKRCFLMIEHDREFYIGGLNFDDAMFCEQIHDLLKSYLGRSIQKISGIDLSYTL